MVPELGIRLSWARGLSACDYRLAMGEGRDFEVRDTATYAPFMRQNHSQGQLDKRKLRDLVRERLKKEIQPSGQFHCCDEDAVAALGEMVQSYVPWSKNYLNHFVINTCCWISLSLCSSLQDLYKSVWHE